MRCEAGQAGGREGVESVSRVRRHSRVEGSEVCKSRVRTDGQIFVTTSSLLEPSSRERGSSLASTP